jgi:membrane protein YqaA with SNARE-associated domain
MPTLNTTVIIGIAMMVTSRKEAVVKPKSLSLQMPILMETAGLVTLTITKLARFVGGSLLTPILDFIAMSFIVIPASKKREVDASKLSRKSRFQSTLTLTVMAGFVTPITIEILPKITALGFLKMPIPNTIATIGTARMASRRKGMGVKK